MNIKINGKLLSAILAFQNEEKEKRAAEPIIANRELIHQNNEKKNRGNYPVG